MCITSCKLNSLKLQISRFGFRNIEKKTRRRREWCRISRAEYYIGVFLTEGFLSAGCHLRPSRTAAGEPYACIYHAHIRARDRKASSELKARDTQHIRVDRVRPIHRCATITSQVREQPR